MGIFNRKVKERDADQMPPWQPYFNRSMAGINVTQDNSLGVVTVYRCCELISSTLASLSIHVYRDGEQIRPTPRIVVRPNPSENKIDTYSALITSALLRGNGFALLGDYDRFGFPQQLVVVNPDSVNVQMNQNGVITYKIGNTTYTPQEIFHLRGFVRPGHIVGSGVLDLQTHGLGLAIAEHQYTERIFSEGSIPSGVISTDNDMTPETAQQLKNSWMNAHMNGDRSPAVLSGGLKYSPIQLSNSDLELLEARKWSASQIAAMFGVPAHLAGAPTNDSLTYSTVSEDTRAFIRFGVRPWMVRLQQSITDILPRGQSASISLGDYLAPDLLTRMQAAEIAIRAGIKSPEEVRLEEGLSND